MAVAAQEAGPTSPWPAFPAFDPSKNVGDLVDAEARFQNSMREQEAKFQNALREAEKDAAKRVDAVRGDYEKRIADLLAQSVRDNSNLLSTQLSNGFTEIRLRLVELERFRWETGGKTAATDPALAATLADLVAAVAKLRSTGDVSSGSSSGRLQLWTLIVGGGLFLVAIITVIVTVITVFRPAIT